jgi:hypothetical protein
MVVHPYSCEERSISCKLIHDPAKNGFRLEDSDDISELVCGLMRNSLDFGGQNSQRHLLNTIGFDGMIEFTLQD